jgi:hypothetical protein
MQMLLRWAIRFVENLADDIIPAYDEYLELRSRTPDQRRRTGRQNRRNTSTSGLREPGCRHPVVNTIGVLKPMLADGHLLFDHKAHDMARHRQASGP